MKMEIECMTCFVKQAVKAAMLSTDDFDSRLKAVKKAVESLSNLDPENTPPEIATEVFKIIARATRNPDAFKELKQKSNESVMALMAETEKSINESEDSFAAAVRISLCGNIIDYGILEDFDVGELIKKEINNETDGEKIKKLKNIIIESGVISFIADNAGEIGFDGLLLKEFKKLNPEVNITVFVKSSPIINDATREDAQYFGLDKEFEIIEYPDTVGFKLKGIPREVRKIIDGSTCIVSKGQANYEILNDAGLKNIVFLLRAKCGVVARNIGVEEGSPVIIVESGRRE